jgi:glyoxylate reductase
MPQVFITREIPAVGLELLKQAGFNVSVHPGEPPLTRAELLLAVAGCDALITMLSDTVDDALLAAAPTLRVVANYAVGTNNIDIAACTRRQVVISNTPDVLTEATADLALALLLAVARRLLEGDALVRSGRWQGWEPLQLLGLELHGQTIGIIGLGRIGQAVARRAHGFGMELLYYNRTRNQAAENALGVRYAPLTELLANSDFVSLHTPLTADTRHLIGEAELQLMKPSAVIINTARGPVIDEAALYRALREGRLWGAGLDVFEQEPQLTPGLTELPNVVLAPHLGSATITARNRMARLCAEAVIAVLTGSRPKTLVNPEVYA